MKKAIPQTSAKNPALKVTHMVLVHCKSMTATCNSDPLTEGGKKPGGSVNDKKFGKNGPFNVSLRYSLTFFPACRHEYRLVRVCTWQFIWRNSYDQGDGQGKYSQVLVQLIHMKATECQRKAFLSIWFFHICDIYLRRMSNIYIALTNLHSSLKMCIKILCWMWELPVTDTFS